MTKHNSKQQKRNESNTSKTKASKGNPKLEGPNRPST
jgi:hypothetical protein